MSREIKFRAIDEKGGFLYSSYPRRPLSEFFRNVEEFCDSKTLTQFTGLKDKNGKEIYEGDIITVVDKNEPVYYTGSAFCIVFPLAGVTSIDELTPETIEIIGNIHENPELLK